MKKNLLKILSCFCMATVIMGGCGSDTKATLADGTVAIEEDQTTEESIEKSTEDVAEEPTKESVEEPTEEPIEESAEESVEEPAKDWFAKHGLVITPQGDFTFTTMAYDDSRNDAATIEVITDAVITETTDGVEDGYKKVTMVWNMDLSATNGLGLRGCRLWTSALDRYTGIVFTFDSSTTTIEMNEGHKEGFVTIVNGDESYDVSVSYENAANYPYITSTATVICPTDYDGVVFQIGYNDLELKEVNQTIDYTARLYTLDELPYFGERYYYFSYSNK